MLTRPLIICAVLGLTGCAHTAYFPDALAGNGACGPVLSDHENEWYSRFLYAAGEPSLVPLTQQPTTDDVVRFLYLSSFDTHIVIRLNIPATGRVRLTAKQVTGDGRYYPYLITRNFSQRLSTSESTRVRDLVATARLSQIPSNGCEGPGLDGDTWVIESVQARQYHYINRWALRTGEVWAFGVELARLARWEDDLATD